MRLREVNWLVPPPDAGLRCAVKLRAREEPHGATVRATADGAEVRLDAPALPAPGQACVFYAASACWAAASFAGRIPDSGVSQA